MAFATLAAVFYELLGTRGWAGLLVLPLVPSLTLLIGVGNVDALVLAGTVALWALTASGRWRAAGILVGALASLKLTPAILLIWLIATRKWTAVKWAVGTGLVLVLVVVIGTEPGIWFRYLRVMSEGSLGGNTTALAVLLFGMLGIALIRDHAGWSFALSAILMPLGSPVAAGHSWSLILGSVTPMTREGGPAHLDRAEDDHPAAHVEVEPTARATACR